MTHTTIHNKAWQWILIITLLSVFTLPAQAAIPDTVDYQGYLTDSGGSPVNGTVFISFSLYNVDSGGIALWSDIRSVTVSNGLFNVKLGGTGSPFPTGLFDAPLWLGIDVAGDGEMTPRATISSAAFAFKADDALTLDGQTAGSLDQSAHVTDTSNPHSVTATQTGAASSADYTLHTGDPSAHHAKTTSFTDLSDQAADAQLPAVITRDAEIMPTVLANDGSGSTLDADTLDGINSSALEESAEIDADILVHAANAAAHHAKTTSFTELTDLASDAQLPALIARDAEIMPTVLANDGPGSTLNADLLDGLNSTAFMSSGTDNWVNIGGDTMTGNLGVMARVGIGTVTPGYGLDVRGGVSSYLGYFLNDNNTSGNAHGISAIADAYDTGTGWGYGTYFYGRGGSTSGNAYGTRNFAYAYGTSTAYGVYSNATGGSTSGREYAFYGVGEAYVSGDVGIGTASPSAPLDIVTGTSTVEGTIEMTHGSEGSVWSFALGGAGATAPGSLGIRDGGVYRMLIDQTGNLVVGTTTVTPGYRLQVSGSALLNSARVSTTTEMLGNVAIGTTAPSWQLEVLDTQATSTVASFRNDYFGTSADGIRIQIGPLSNPSTVNDYVQFFDGDGTFVGYINGNGAGGVNYTSVSDARLKTNIVDFAGGLDVVSRMKVRQYEFIEAPGNERIGFLAQELQTVFPQAVSGSPEDNVDEKPMGVDYGRVTPVLVSAIQELMAKNKALEARLAVLEARAGK